MDPYDTTSSPVIFSWGSYIVGLMVGMFFEKYYGQYTDLFFISDTSQWLVYIGYQIEPSYVDISLENLNREQLYIDIRKTIHQIHSEKGIQSLIDKCYWDSWQNCTIVSDSMEDHTFDSYLRLINDKMEYCSTDKLFHISKQLVIFLENIT